jgi:hypothetical protein
MDWRAELDALERKLGGIMIASKETRSIVAAVDEAFKGSEEGLQEAIKRGCEVAHMAVRNADEAQMASDHARINMVLSTLYYVNHVVVASNEAQRIFAEGPRPVSAPGGGGEAKKGKKAKTIADQAQRAALTAGIARFSAPDPEEANRMQQLLLYLLDTAHVRGYRRRHGMLYERRMLSESESDKSIDTHAWELVCDLKEFVYEATRKEVNYDMWLNMTSVRGTVGSAVDYLLNCQDVQLPDLERDRSVFSFRNGIYIAKRDQFVVYGSPEHAALPTHLVAAKFFDLDMDLENVGKSDPVDIPTPHLQSILDFQDMSPEVSWWMYAMIGRLIYEVNELDGWQVVPFLKGAASSGKSTILTRVCQSIYERDDVGVLSNNIERKFGLSAIYDKLIFIGPEIKADIQLEQAEFQSIISGEAVQVAVKCQTARSVAWKVPGALAGNEVPRWVDNSGSINRRIILFCFPKRVHDGDMDLGKKLENDMAAILLKANRIYLEAVRKYARKNIWAALPKEFHLAKEEFSEATNSIVQFLRSGKLVFAKDLCMPFELFSGAYESFVNSMGLVRLKMNGDRITHPLLEAGCKIIKNTTLKYPKGSNSIVTGRFIIGADFAPSAAEAEGMGSVVAESDPLEIL